MTISGRLEVETADHVVLRYTLAGAGTRAQAALVDSLLTIVMLTCLGVAIASVSESRASWLAGLLILAAPVLVIGYFAVLEWLWNGQTVGKRSAGLRVIARDGSPAGFAACLIRNLVRPIDFLPFGYGIGFIAVVLSPGGQRLGDLAAGTYVVRAPVPQVDWLSLRTVAAAPTGRPAATVRALPAEVQRIVREFAAREAALALPERTRLAATIAARLRPLAPDLAAAGDRELILALAQALRAGGDLPQAQ